MTEIFKCPECESDKIKFRFKVNYTTDVYAGVTEEIQCANCFMDIPSNLFIIDKNTNIQDGNRDRFYAEKELADINSLYASSFKSAESHISELQNGDYEKYFTVIENDHKVYRNLQI